MLKIKNPRQKGQTETVCNMIMADVYKDMFITKDEFYNECIFKLDALNPLKQSDNTYSITVTKEELEYLLKLKANKNEER